MKNLKTTQQPIDPANGTSAGHYREKAAEPREDGHEERGPVSGPSVAELLSDLQRTRADFENFRKQVDLQREQAKTTAANATVLKFLPLIDDLDRALAAYPEQLSALSGSFAKTLAGLGLARIDTAPGTEFNPDFHEAVSMEDGDGDREVIAETLRPGYLYQGEVLRPAMVRVKHEVAK